MKQILFICLALLLMSAKDRRSSPPYITGDGFRNVANFVIEKKKSHFDPSKVRKGDVIFVATDYLPKFFGKYHPKIEEKYVLVTHNGDLPVPGAFASYLNDPKILAWYGQNVEGVVHHKLHPLPIGIENRYNSNGNPDVVAQAQVECKALAKKFLLYSNFSIGTCPGERGHVAGLFQDKPYCYVSSRKAYPLYLADLAESKFVLCPRGNGLDCHRTWEALYMGAIPIVKTSASDALFQDLPVIIVGDWTEVTEEFLQRKEQEMQGRSYALDRLTIDYWLAEIQKARKSRR